MTIDVTRSNTDTDERLAALAEQVQRLAMLVQGIHGELATVWHTERPSFAERQSEWCMSAFEIGCAVRHIREDAAEFVAVRAAQRQSHETTGRILRKLSREPSVIQTDTAP